MLNKKLKHPWFVFLFPVFFVFHGFTENFGFVSIQAALFLATEYIIASIVLTAIFYFFSKNLLQAAVMSMLVMFFHFFFGIIHDFLKEIFGTGFFRKYIFILPLFLMLFATFYVILKRKKDLSRISVYLNILFSILILFDIFSLIKKENNEKNGLASISKSLCNTCKTNIYIILLDSYPGEEYLKAIRFDNSSFLNQLSKRNFKTYRNTRSNYLFTPYSTASILNMEYIDSNKINSTRERGIPYALKKINNNKLISFFQSSGYKFYNYSIFQVAGQPASTSGAFVPANAKLINANTFISRFEKDVMINIATKLHWKWWLQRELYQAHNDNEMVYSLTLKNVSTDTIHPKIVLTHLEMPHDPYYFNDSEKLRNFDELSRIGLEDVNAFLSNLKYSNKKVIDLIDSILLHSPTPPAIILFSDHGFRYDNSVSKNYRFDNFFSVYFPDGNYTGLHDSITAINFFPAILNNRFHQNFPLHADSTFTFAF